VSRQASVQNSRRDGDSVDEGDGMGRDGTSWVIVSVPPGSALAGA
jgi:hypothetical protein